MDLLRRLLSCAFIEGDVELPKQQGGPDEAQPSTAKGVGAHGQASDVSRQPTTNSSAGMTPLQEASSSGAYEGAERFDNDPLALIDEDKQGGDAAAYGILRVPEDKVFSLESLMSELRRNTLSSALGGSTGSSQWTSATFSASTPHSSLPVVWASKDSGIALDASDSTTPYVKHTSSEELGPSGEPAGNMPHPVSSDTTAVPTSQSGTSDLDLSPRRTTFQDSTSMLNDFNTALQQYGWRSSTSALSDYDGYAAGRGGNSSPSSESGLPGSWTRRSSQSALSEFAAAAQLGMLHKQQQAHLLAEMGWAYDDGALPSGGLPSGSSAMQSGLSYMRPEPDDERQEAAEACGLSAVLQDVQVIKCIGKGAHGRVYKALWQDLIVAVKVIQHEMEFMPGVQLPAEQQSPGSLGPLTGAAAAAALMAPDKKRMLEGMIGVSAHHAHIVETFKIITQPIMTTEGRALVVSRTDTQGLLWESTSFPLPGPSSGARSPRLPRPPGSLRASSFTSSSAPKLSLRTASTVQPYPISLPTAPSTIHEDPSEPAWGLPTSSHGSRTGLAPLARLVDGSLAGGRPQQAPLSQAQQHQQQHQQHQHQQRSTLLSDDAEQQDVLHAEALAPTADADADGADSSSLPAPISFAADFDVQSQRKSLELLMQCASADADVDEEPAQRSTSTGNSITFVSPLTPTHAAGAYSSKSSSSGAMSMSLAPPLDASMEGAEQSQIQTLAVGVLGRTNTSGSNESAEQAATMLTSFRIPRGSMSGIAPGNDGLLSASLVDLGNGIGASGSAVWGFRHRRASAGGIVDSTSRYRSYRARRASVSGSVESLGQQPSLSFPQLENTAMDSSVMRRFRSRRASIGGSSNMGSMDGSEQSISFVRPGFRARRASACASIDSIDEFAPISFANLPTGIGESGRGGVIRNRQMSMGTSTDSIDTALHATFGLMPVASEGSSGKLRHGSLSTGSVSLGSMSAVSMTGSIDGGEQAAARPLLKPDSLDSELCAATTLAALPELGPDPTLSPISSTADNTDHSLNQLQDTQQQQQQQQPLPLPPQQSQDPALRVTANESNIMPAPIMSFQFDEIHGSKPHYHAGLPIAASVQAKRLHCQSTAGSPGMSALGSTGTGSSTTTTTRPRRRSSLQLQAGPVSTAAAAAYADALHEFVPLPISAPAGNTSDGCTTSDDGMGPPRTRQGWEAVSARAAQQELAGRATASRSRQSSFQRFSSSSSAPTSQEHTSALSPKHAATKMLGTSSSVWRSSNNSQATHAVSVPSSKSRSSSDRQQDAEHNQPSQEKLLLSFSERGSFVGSYVGSAAPSRRLWRTYIIQEFCNKGSLRDALYGGAFHRKVPEDGVQVINMQHIVQTLLEVAQAMAYLHSKRLVHGDLHCANVLLQNSNNTARGFVAKLSDFGLARMLASSDEELVVSRFGTVSHMPPETIRDNVVVLASDSYSFGILMWEVYCVEKPFSKYTPFQLLAAVVQHHERPQFPSHCPAAFAALALECMAADYHSRPLMSMAVARLQRMLMELQPLVTVPFTEAHREAQKIYNWLVSSPYQSGGNALLNTAAMDQELRDRMEDTGESHAGSWDVVRS